jgi:hypothetical protein
MNIKIILGIVFTLLLSCASLISSAESPGLNNITQEKKPKKRTILYIVDGKAMSAKEADKIKTEQIEKMEFVKEKEQIRKYTDEDVDMVALISMKKSVEKDSTSVENEGLIIENQ